MTTRTTPKITLWEFFQQLGKTFMLPVALLSFCGIMLGIGSSLSSHDVLTLIPALGNPVLCSAAIFFAPKRDKFCTARRCQKDTFCTVQK